MLGIYKDDISGLRDYYVMNFYDDDFEIRYKKEDKSFYLNREYLKNKFTIAQTIQHLKDWDIWKMTNKNKRRENLFIPNYKSKELEKIFHNSYKQHIKKFHWNKCFSTRMIINEIEIMENLGDYKLTHFLFPKLAPDYDMYEIFKDEILFVFSINVFLTATNGQHLSKIEILADKLIEIWDKALNQYYKINLIF